MPVISLPDKMPDGRDVPVPLVVVVWPRLRRVAQRHAQQSLIALVRMFLCVQERFLRLNGMRKQAKAHSYVRVRFSCTLLSALSR